MDKKAIAFFAFILLAGSIHAQDSVRISSDTTAATATKTVLGLKLQPVFEKADEPGQEFGLTGSVEIINRDDIERLPYAVNIADVLFYALGVDVRKEQPLSDRAKVSMRANASEQVSIHVNGVIINNTMDNGLTLSLLPVPLSAVERIEVLRGSRSRAYGDGATGGVINIVTRTEVSGAGGVKVGFAGGNNDTFIPEALLAFNNKLNTTILAYQGDFKACDDLGMTKTSIFADSRFRLAKWFEPRVTAGLNKASYTSPSEPHFLENDSRLKDNMLNYFVETDFNFLFGRRYSMWLKLMFNHQYNDMDPLGFRNTAGDDPFAIYKLATLQYDNKSQYVVDLGGSFTSKLYDLDYGIKYKSSHLYSSYMEAEILGEWRKVTSEPYSYYKFQASRDIAEVNIDNTFHLGKLDVGGGILLTMSPDHEGIIVAGGGEVSYKFTDGLKIYAGGDHSVREANFYERFVSLDSIAGKGGLTPEKVTTAEAGFKYKNRYSSVGVSAYYQWGKEQIVLAWEPTVGQYVFRNSVEDDLLKYLGLELFYEADIEKLTSGKIPVSKLRLQYAYNDGDFEGLRLERKHDYLRHKASVLLSSRLFSKLHFDASHTFQSRSGLLAKNRGGDFSNYGFDNILNARLSWKEKGWEVYMQGANLLDVEYYDSSYNRSPGISLLLGARIKLNFVK